MGTGAGGGGAGSGSTIIGAASGSGSGSKVTISIVIASGSGGGFRSGTMKFPDKERKSPTCTRKTSAAVVARRWASSSRKLERRSSS